MQQFLTDFHQIHQTRPATIGNRNSFRYFYNKSKKIVQLAQPVNGIVMNRKDWGGPNGLGSPGLSNLLLCSKERFITT